MDAIKHSETPGGNLLFPVFLKIEHLKVLVVGGGFVGWEKANALLSNCPHASVLLVAPEIRSEITDMAQTYPNLQLRYECYNKALLDEVDLVIAATNFKAVNQQINADARACKMLVNVADTPHLCDFYLSSIVKKGDLKIAISTNGKSPTFAKRFRETLEEILPESIQEILDNLQGIRNKLKGDFVQKLNKLNEITSVMRDSG